MDLCLISLMNYLDDWTSSRLNALHRYNIISLVLYHYNLVGKYSQSTAGSIHLYAQISHVFDRLKDLCWTNYSPLVLCFILVFERLLIWSIITLVIDPII
ncbi:hypothetical protein ARMSODRAFT_621424 [Armillaria solidipes]|uniref:Uncharacterized protein n=1 Tax=Armillaria solidipes TaxID=1076256 RepID=A0A2H3B710_9AGAR|nr:hypothetical protein ARMSODRAFT_621424 [Armillaria solidipes]